MMTKLTLTIDPNDFVLGETKELIRLKTATDHLAISLAMIAQAKYNLYIFNPHLDPDIYDQAKLVETISKFARRSDKTKVYIIIEHGLEIVQRSHQLLAMAHRLSSFIQIKKVHKDYEGYDEAFLIADDSAYIHRRISEFYQGHANFYDSHQTKELTHLFQRIWDCSQVDVELRQLSL